MARDERDTDCGEPSAREAPGRSVLLTVAYDGRPFSGFAAQPGRRTVAGELLAAIREVDPSVREVRGASRTDAGVHAQGQRVAFDPGLSIPPRGWVLAVGRRLPREIAVRRAALVGSGFSPRFASTGKEYRYLILRNELRDPFLEGRAWRVEERLDAASLDLARAEAEALVGTHDFAAFRSSADRREITHRTLTAVRVEEDPADPRLVRVTVSGSAFLHNMVRILVGTLVDVARGRLAPGACARALASGDRRHAGRTAPPDGLCLERVDLDLGGDGEGQDPWPSGGPGA